MSGFFAFQLFPDSSQTALLSQTAAQRFERLAALDGSDLNLPVHLVVAYLDILLLCDFGQEERALYFSFGALASIASLTRVYVRTTIPSATARCLSNSGSLKEISTTCAA